MTTDRPAGMDDLMGLLRSLVGFEARRTDTEPAVIAARILGILATDLEPDPEALLTAWTNALGAQLQRRGCRGVLRCTLETTMGTVGLSASVREAPTVDEEAAP